jgi:2-C-methyl-D-erythritol 2,4-cyclodiphosphate synthase
MRIGLGIDTHQLIPGKSIRLGGVDIPSNVSIKAHSDGDIVYHAIADALYGAISMGDIGDHFPDTDPNNKGLDSGKIIEDAATAIVFKEYNLVNMDVVLLLESPNISKQKEQMKDNIARILINCGMDDVGKHNINIKASTSESLGFIGKGEGVTCYCIVSLA